MSDHVGQNVRRVMAARGVSARRLAARSGLDARTIRAVLRGRHRPRADTLHRLADALEVSIDELFVDPARLLYRRYDRATNPAVAELVERRPELFDEWSEQDFDELHSRVGVGGALSEEGARRAVEHMNRKRRLHQMLDVLLETDQARIIAGMIELLHDQVVVAPPEEPADVARAREKN